MIAIIAVRMVLSVAFNEQAAEVFGRVSVSFLFFYFICQISKNKYKSAQSHWALTNPPLIKMKISASR